MLKHFFIRTTLTFFIIFFYSLKAEGANQQKSKNTNNEFDQFSLAQSWPQTNCWDLNYKQSKLPKDYSCNPCKQPLKNNNWTLHGLWPNRYNGHHPFFCDNSAPFNWNRLSEDLKVELHRNWPTYKLKLSDRNFWNHEWKKHGTCALQVESTNSQSKYFAKALELLHQYNIGSVLQKSGVIPGHEYKLDTINRAIKEVLKVNVFVDCARLPETGKQYIMQVHTCFDKDFNLVNCYRRNGNLSNCRKKEYIVYPKLMKSC